jgi:hypothetical protein
LSDNHCNSLQVAVLFADHPRICSTISAGELLANVGIAKEPAPVREGRRSQAKIRAYHDSDMRDKQSPLAVGRWNASERILVTAAQ